MGEEKWGKVSWEGYDGGNITMIGDLSKMGANTAGFIKNGGKHRISL